MRFLLIITGVLSPLTVLALSYESSNLPYTDVPTDLPTQIAISTLTDLGIVQGNPDGSFKPNVPLNRAEFMKIAMSLLPPATSYVPTNCFPDVVENIWFTEPVCRAKSMGIVSGNAVKDVPADQWLFEPARSVKYEEALKILSGIYGTPMLTVEGQWYEKYVRSAENIGVQLPDSAPGSGLTRGQIARLVVAYLAHSYDELDELRAAESGAQSSSSSARTVFSAPSSSSSSVSSVSTSSDVYDSLIDDTSTDDAVLVLGKVTHILGAAELFADLEPIRVHYFLIDIVAANSSLEAMNVYDDRGKFLGRATLDSSVAGKMRYRLGVKNQAIILPKRDEYSFYVRGVMRSQDSGGTSGGSVQLDEMGIEGIGDWSNRDYEVMTSGEAFSKTTVARSAITSIGNAGDDRSILIEGSDMEIGAFRFAGVTGHSAARIDITAIDFTIGSVGGTTVSNATIRVDGSSERHSCSVASSVLTCSSLPASYGRLDDGPRTLRVYADIDAPDASVHAGLQISINDPGSIGSAGDITWTDGVTSFTWIDINESPLARGTYYSY
jgi:hypothetical protein